MKRKKLKFTLWAAVHKSDGTIDTAFTPGVYATRRQARIHKSYRRWVRVVRLEARER